jgi:hypothetical protein
MSTAPITAAWATALAASERDRIDRAGREHKSSRSILPTLPMVHAEDWHGARRADGVVTNPRHPELRRGDGLA